MLHLNPSPTNPLLELVAQGKQNEAKAMIEKNPDLLLIKGVVTDYSFRTFKRIINSSEAGITPFHYTLWARDYHMWKMLLRHLPIKDAKIQMQEFVAAKGVEYEQNNIIKGELHYDFDAFIEIVKKYQDICEDMHNKKMLNITAGPISCHVTSDQLRIEWLKVGVAQRDVPAHIANEWCCLARTHYMHCKPFEEIDNVISLTRTLMLSELWIKKGIKSPWFPLSNQLNARLGVDFAIGTVGEKSYFPLVGRGEAGPDYHIGIKRFLLNDLNKIRKHNFNQLHTILCNQTNLGSWDKILNVFENYPKIAQASQLFDEIKKKPDERLNTNGDTALMFAAWYGCDGIVFELLNNCHCNVNLKNTSDLTALSFAITKEHTEIALNLIESKRCDLNLKNLPFQRTALIYAIDKGYQDIASALIIAGANVHLCDAKNKTALDHALVYSNIFIINLLLSHGVFINNPKHLFWKLKYCDQREPGIASSLNILCQQQKNLREAKATNEGSIWLSEEDYQEAKKLLARLLKLDTKFSSSVYKNMCKTTEKITANGIPKEVLKMICSYDSPIAGNRIRFFQSYEELRCEEVKKLTDTMLDKVTDQCIVM